MDTWKIGYWNIYNDACEMTLTVPSGTHPFKIVGIAKRTIPLWNGCRYYKKLQSLIKP